VRFSRTNSAASKIDILFGCRILRKVINMLVAEYDYDTDIAVQKALETAKLMLQRDYPSTEICMMTGLSQAEVEALG